MLANLSEKFGVEANNAKLVNAAINSGNTWALSCAAEFMHIYSDSPDKLPELVKQVFDILDMWITIENSIHMLSIHERDALQDDNAQMRFDGFDGNHETTAMGIAEFAIRKLGKFSWFKDRDVNAHSQRLPSYIRMLSVYKPINQTIQDRLLNKDQLRAVLLVS